MSLNKPNNEIDISTLANQDTLENVQTTTNTINTTLGKYAGGDTDNIVSDIEALKQAVSLLTTKTDSLQENVTDIETVVNQIASGGSGITSVIRRIQRGIFSIGRRDAYKEISLSGFSELAKMIVILNSGGKSDNYTAFGNAAYISLTLNKLTIYNNVDMSMTGSYQVIEFY